MWIGGGGGGGGSGGLGGVRLCPLNSVIYTRNRKCLPESPLIPPRRFLGWRCLDGQGSFFLCVRDRHQ